MKPCQGYTRRDLLITSLLAAQSVPAVTSLTRKVRYRTPGGHTVTLKRGPLEAVIADNAASGAEHRAGYNGVASLTHSARRENLFVPKYSGLNLEFIHDGYERDASVLFEPRRAPMELRLVNNHTAELYQPPAPRWKLESCTRFVLERRGVIRMAFECIPRAEVFRQGYIGLFWANYIHQPESPAWGRFRRLFRQWIPFPQILHPYHSLRFDAGSKVGAVFVMWPPESCGVQRASPISRRQPPMP